MANSFNDILGQRPRTSLPLALVLMVKDNKAHEIPQVLGFSVPGREPTVHHSELLGVNFQMETPVRTGAGGQSKKSKPRTKSSLIQLVFT